MGQDGMRMGVRMGRYRRAWYGVGWDRVRMGCRPGWPSRWVWAVRCLAGGLRHGRLLPLHRVAGGGRQPLPPLLRQLESRGPEQPGGCSGPSRLLLLYGKAVSPIPITPVPGGAEPWARGCSRVLCSPHPGRKHLPCLEPLQGVSPLRYAGQPWRWERFWSDPHHLFMAPASFIPFLAPPRGVILQGLMTGEGG